MNRACTHKSTQTYRQKGENGVELCCVILVPTNTSSYVTTRSVKVIFEGAHEKTEPPDIIKEGMESEVTSATDAICP